MDLSGLTIYRDSVVEKDDTTYFLASKGDGKRQLGIEGDGSGFEGKWEGQVLLCPLTSANAAVLRSRLAWLRPVPLDVGTSFGFGDRLGLATPGHARAVQTCEGIVPIFAQQSVRENARTGRTPQEVVDDALWGVLEVGWRRPWGADADHIKTSGACDAFIAAGYTFYTIDPGDHVDNEAHTAPLIDLEAKVEALPWDSLETKRTDLERRYLDRSFDLDDIRIAFDREILYRAAAKYGRAIAHTVQLYRYLAEQMGDRPFDLEVSVDETETPTTPEEHTFIVGELQRLGVKWVSLAPRYIGRFEKGVDYVGIGSARGCSSAELDAFGAEIASHAAIARAFGPYKLSLHSGSDKFTIYPIIAEHTHGLVHVKTAGTSYLEALRALAQVDPAFFCAILALARERYETERATYHVSAELERVPPVEVLNERELSDLLEQFDARQILHVTYGSVLDAFGDRLLAALEMHRDVYARLLEGHFQRHLAPFAQA
ncbi:MAG: tagaturonate epimerase family protein [Anaerolineales bacterium]